MELTADIHQALTPYKVSGAQHGTSGNNSDRLRQIARQTRTTKANVATALQMISWGLEVNDYGNAILDDAGEFIKVQGQGVTDDMWRQMKAHAESQGWKVANLMGRHLMPDQITAHAESISYSRINLNQSVYSTSMDDTGPDAFQIATPEAKVYAVAGGIASDETSPFIDGPQLPDNEGTCHQASYFSDQFKDETGSLHILLIFHLLILVSVVGCYIYLAASGAEIPEELREALRNIIAYCIGIASGIAISPQCPRP